MSEEALSIEHSAVLVPLMPNLSLAVLVLLVRSQRTHTK